jgi:hypothetical protein
MMIDTAKYGKRDHGKSPTKILFLNKNNINEMQQSIPRLTIAQHSCSISFISPELLDICTNNS